ncbi:L-dopachrome tautomerase-related protein [Hasllibacter halocynthiae]|nr:L-dopachrome tautomerase-related protein [Hasllibacter halocynthiae]
MEPDLEPLWAAQRVWNGVALDADGTPYVSFPSADGRGVQAARIGPGDALVPFPDEPWNRLRREPDPDAGFVNVNALRFGPDGLLWIVDAGAPGIGEAAVEGGGRLLAFEAASGTLARTIDLAPALKGKSYVDDIRFNGDHVYATDAGDPGLIVIRLSDGAMRRVLGGHPSTTDRRPMRADGTVLRTKKGDELRVHCDQLEVSPDGQWLYYQPGSGPLYRLPADLLNDFGTQEDALAAAVETSFDSPTTGGTAIDAEGAIYLNAPDTRTLIRIAPDGASEVLLQDDRLIWADAMWLHRDGCLYIPATQQNRTPGFNGGRMAVEYPVWIYRLEIGRQPAPNDHA